MTLHLWVYRFSEVTEDVKYDVSCCKVSLFLSSSNLLLAMLIRLPEVWIKCLITIMLKLRRGHYLQLHKWVKPRLWGCLYQYWFSPCDCSPKLLPEISISSICSYLMCFGHRNLDTYLPQILKYSTTELHRFSSQTTLPICIITLYFDFSTSFYDNSHYTHLGYYCTLARFRHSI